MENVLQMAESQNGKDVMFIPFSISGKYLYVPDGSVQLIRLGKSPLMVKCLTKNLKSHWLRITYKHSIRIRVFNIDTSEDTSSEDGCYFKVVGDDDKAPDKGEQYVELVLYTHGGKGWTKFQPPGSIYVVNSGFNFDNRPWKIAKHKVEGTSHTFTFKNLFYQIGDQLYGKITDECDLTVSDLGSGGGLLYAVIFTDSFTKTEVRFSKTGLVQSDEYFPVSLYWIDGKGNVLADLRASSLVMLA